MFRKLVKTSVILMAALMLVTAALAHPATQAEKIRGTVTAIDEAGGTFTVLTEAGDTVLVTAPEGFDWNSISVGGAVMVFGSPDEDGNVEATKVVDPTGDDDDDGGAGKGKGKGGDDDDGAGKGKGKGQSDGGDDDDDGGAGSASRGIICSGEKENPVVAKIAERYGASSTDINSYFCDGGNGFGRILVALQTAKMTGMSVDELLALSKGEGGWGKVWKDAGVLGNPEHANPPAHAGKPENTGKPEDKGKPTDGDNSNGKGKGKGGDDDNDDNGG